MNPRLGFLGLGWIGRHRLASVSNAGIADIIGIADCDAGACQEASRVAPSAKVAHTLDDLLAMPLDGVVIATPSALHAEQARSALSHGVAVFCQKPLARTEEEATAVVRQACRVNRLLGVDLSYRETQAMNVITDLIWSGGIGEIYAADLTFHNAYGPDREWFYDPARSGGGCLIDLGTHLIDLATYVMRRPIVSVSSQLFAAGRRLELPPSEVEDFAIVHGETSDGRVMNVQCSWRLPAGRDAVIDCRWFGTHGGARFANVNGSFYDFVAERFDGTHTTRLVDPPDEWGGRALIKWITDLSRNGAHDPARGTELVELARIIDRSYGRSAPVRTA